MSTAWISYSVFFTPPTAPRPVQLLASVDLGANRVEQRVSDVASTSVVPARSSVVNEVCRGRSVINTLVKEFVCANRRVEKRSQSVRRL